MSVDFAQLLSAFKHLPTGVPIEEVTLGLGAQQREKVFVSQEHTVRGVNKKGKDFFKFKTNLTETIHNVRVCDLQVRPSALQPALRLRALHRSGCIPDASA